MLIRTFSPHFFPPQQTPAKTTNAKGSAKESTENTESEVR